VLGFVRAFDGDADVVGLLWGQFGESGAETFEVEASDFFIEVLGQRVDFVLVLVTADVHFDLREHLVCKTVAHDETGVAGGAAEVEQATLGEDDDGVAVGEGPAVYLGFDVVGFDAGDFGEAGHVDFVVEVADVADDGIVLHATHVLGEEDIAVAG